ncbi:helix-turn-helix domain-containing protein [Anaerotignum sp. MB30-C6]|uniref:helix-turn-helix domain-containing protein n=1 Tax=Anaerotignum sp. MB30-C6 TaxID=3070814 RepID=UPI0027DB8750|nr:helix-turn-helix transcriptional regulator [Anaerotignum sp. MB30-C6]WMI80551.1 helix-turn-helix transcriptional regulator [Anaerotignum sp. MB30-C6]
MDYKNIGDKIQNARRRKGISQEKLAEELDISVSYIGQIERGARQPSVHILENIGEVLNIPFANLICNLNKEEEINSLWNEETENLSEKEKQSILSILQMLLELLNSNRTRQP